MVYQLAIPLLTFLTVLGIGGAVIAARAGRREAIAARLRGTHDLLDDAAVLDGPSRPAWLEALHQIGRRLLPKGPGQQLRQQLAHAGYHGSAAAPIYIATKVVLLFVGLVVLTPLALALELRWGTTVLVVVGGAVAMSMLTNLAVYARRSRRRREITNHLPDAIDLLEVCVTAGMGLELAWNAVADDIRDVCPILADEMALTNLETHLGASTAEAMRHMADRTQVQDLASLTAVLVQSQRFGTSIAEALRSFADALREQRSQNAQEAAEKMAVKLIFPMVLFVFPAAVIVLAGPAFLQLIEALS